ncbi:hypothetical protein [Metallibacterium sp.]
MRNHDRAKAYLDAHMRYMRSDLTDLRVVIDEACAEAIEEEKAEHRELPGHTVEEVREVTDWICPRRFAMSETKCPLCGRETMKTRVAYGPPMSAAEVATVCLHPAHIYDLELPPCERMGVRRIADLAAEVRETREVLEEIACITTDGAVAKMVREYLDECARPKTV